MEFSLGRDTLPSQAPACAASPVDFVAREITRRISYPDVGSGGSPSVTALWPYCDQYSAQTGEPPLTLSLSMITCQGTTQARKPERACFDIASIRAIQGPYAPARKTSNRCREPPFAPPPSRRSRTDWYGSFPWPCEIMPHRCLTATTTS